MKREGAIVILTVVMLIGAAYLFSQKPIPQPESYHNFADQRTLSDIPNFLNVASNLPFLLVGSWGIAVVIKRRSAFLARPELWAYLVFFGGVARTFFGSSYYHWRPSTPRLVWDRLPMVLAFMGALSSVIAERISPKTARLGLPLLTVIGLLSVFYWSWAETQGRGDLRPYAFVQFGSLLAILI